MVASVGSLDGEVQNEMHVFQKWGRLPAVARKPLGPGEPDRAFRGAGAASPSATMDDGAIMRSNSE